MEGLLQCISDLGVTICVLILLLILTMVYWSVKNSGLPSGPRGWPLIGYTLKMAMKKDTWHFHDLTTEYGSDVIGIPVLMNLVVLLNTVELCRDIYQKRNDVKDRPSTSLFKIYQDDFTGIGATNGKIWKEARKFSISNLKDFGMGRIGAEERIRRESDILCQFIKISNGKKLDPSKCFEVAVSNGICGLVFGQRFDADDEEFCEALEGMTQFMKNAAVDVTFLLGQFKFGREYLVKKQIQLSRKELERFTEFTFKQIEKHRKDYNGEVTDLIFAFLQEMENGNDPEVYNDKMLESLVVDYFFAGTETSFETLRWGVLAMASNPEIQRRIQEELDETVDGTPTLDDRKKTPYCEAVICEIQRYYTLLPQGPPHCNTDEITIHGYRIPKQSLIFSNLYWIHHDPKVWKNPNAFDPENFLDENGKLMNLDKLIPFSVGRRACAGEALAKAEIYIFFAGLVKNFEIRFPDGVTKDQDFVAKYSPTYTAKPFEVIFSAR